MTWSLRGEVPVTPFNVHAIVMPLAAYLLALVAWHQRVPWAGVAVIVLGSWSSQAHLTAVGPVVVAGLVVGGAVLVQHRRGFRAERPDARRLAVGAGVLALCWIGPVLDVVTNEGGNVRAVLGARSDLASEAIGVGTATDIVVRSIAVRPVWASGGAHPSELVQGALLAARFPGDYLSLLALHNHLWLWPLTVALWGTALVALGLEIQEQARARSLRLHPGVLLALPAVALLAVGVASLGEPHRNLTLAAPSYVRALGDGVLDEVDPDEVDPDETYRVTISGEFDSFFIEVGLLTYLEGAGLDLIGPERYRSAFGDRRTTAPGPIAGDLVVDLGWDAAEPTGGSGQLVAEHRPPPELMRERDQVEDRLVARLRDSGHLPLWGMASTEEAEVRRWLREDLDGFLLAGFVPDGLAAAPETVRYLDLWREPVLHASVHLVRAG